MSASNSPVEAKSIENGMRVSTTFPQSIRLSNITLRSCALRLKEPLQVEGKVYLPEYFEWNIADENDSSFGNLQHLRADEQQDVCDYFITSVHGSN